MTLIQRIWQILVSSGCTTANAYNRVQFTSHFSADGCELRICDKLGSGGKLYVNRSRLYVGCYCEDRTPQREDRINTANAALGELFQER